MSGAADAAIADGAARLRAARRVVVLTGAGISAESGIPTFRDAQTGLWAKYDPATLASPEGFERDPKLVWEWYEHRRARVREVEPNAGHRALVDLERFVPDVAVVTQNVDGLHAKAGSRRILELHGRLLEDRCFRDGRLLGEADLDRSTVPPRCPCGAFARPGVVWFGEMLPADVLAEAMDAAGRCDVCLVVGTSGVVQPAASIPLVAKRAAAFLVEVNPEASALTPVADVFLRGKAGEVLPRLVQALDSMPA